MPPISVDELKISKLTLSKPYNAMFGTKLYYINHDHKYLRLKTPTLITPFGISQYTKNSDLTIRLQFDPNDTSHEEFIRALCEIEDKVRENLASNKPFRSIVKIDNKGNEYIKLSLNCVNIDEFEGNIFDVKSREYTDHVRPQSKVNCEFHISHMYLQSQASGIKIIAQKINIEDRLNYPSNLTEFAFRDV